MQVYETGENFGLFISAKLDKLVRFPAQYLPLSIPSTLQTILLLDWSGTLVSDTSYENSTDLWYRMFRLLSFDSGSVIPKLPLRQI